MDVVGLLVDRAVDLGALLEAVASGAVEEGGNLLERKRAVATARLDNEEVAVDDLEGEEHAEDDVVLPVELGHGDGVDVLVEDERGVDGHLHRHETLGTNAEGQNLDRVGNEERRHGNVVESVEQEDEGDDTVTSVLVGVEGNTLLRVTVVVNETLGLKLGGRVAVDSGADRPADERDKHTASRGQEEEATTNAVDSESSHNGPEVVVDLEDTVDESLVTSRGDANGLEDNSEVVL